MELKEFVGFFDFTYYLNHGFIMLEDLQGANLGDIEGDTFASAEDIVDRLSTYFMDYVDDEIIYHIENKIGVWRYIDIDCASYSYESLMKVYDRVRTASEEEDLLASIIRCIVNPELIKMPKLD